MEAYEQLEHALAEWEGTGGLYSPEQVVACSSGTAALHLTLEALGLPPGSEVLVPDYTMIACARAVTLAGLVPVFVDCDERLNMSWDAFCRYRNSMAKVLMAVHVYGRKFDRGLIESAQDFHHLVVEDLAEAHGVAPHPDTDAACYSFFKNKIIAGEEGGAVAFRDVKHARIARELRSLGFTAAHDFRHRPRGHNYRLANCLAAKILSSLGRYATQWGLRRVYERWYDEFCPDAWRMPPRDAPWVYDLRVPGMRRGQMADVVRVLNGEGIAARMGFLPMGAQEEYQDCRVVWDERFMAFSGVAANEVFYLPLQPGIVTRELARSSFEILRSSLS